MAKARIAYVCEDCGADHTKWQGQCSACASWNTLKQVTVSKLSPVTENVVTEFAKTSTAVQQLADIRLEDSARIETGLSELDRVLGGGFVPGSVVLIGGEPGAGKSTLLLQVVTELAKKIPCLYVSGEESHEQIAERARRLELPNGNVQIASLTFAEQVAELVTRERPGIVIIDSIQVMQMSGVESVPGSVPQVRESAAFLTRLAKQTGTAIVLVGHITKEGNIAGPKILEHIIDCFLMLDSSAGSRFRTLRGIKNRFGAVNELGVFAMTDRGLREVKNPSAIFLERPQEMTPGSVVTVTWEGTRPILVEIQALVDQVQGGYPKRVAVGLDGQRLGMHLAVMHRHCGVSLADQDVFANVAGGARVAETAADLALLVSVFSSYRNKSLPKDLVVFGELGLTGEIRPVPNGQERLREAQKHGFTQALVPRANRPRAPIN
ncbi:MAG: DNA repair protein RadA, partial [Pseudomonadales bacterium]|nr:DNA repair protein RadA [Pseudomonadales bacterium]